MKSRPILFNAPMVRALLHGSKTQTRRVAKIKHVEPHPQNPIIKIATMEGVGKQFWANSQVDHPNHISKACPYGQVGDQLWVRETTVKVEDHGYEGPVYAESDYGKACFEFGLSPSEDDVTEVEPEDIKLRPSIFMPRAMSRITLEITSVRVERLQDITRGDCMAEGCPFPNIAKETDPKGWYSALWASINGADSWDANPWVWVIEFKKVTKESAAA